MAEPELDSKNPDTFTRNTTSDTLNTQNLKDDKNTNMDLDLKMDQDLNLPVDFGAAPDSSAADNSNDKSDTKLADLPAESESKASNMGEKSQTNQSSDLIKGLSLPIELDPNFGPERVTYDIEDLNIPIQLEENSTPTNLNALVKKLDIPCDSEAIKNEIQQSKQKFERIVPTRYSKRNAARASNLGLKLNGLSYKNQMDYQDLSTSLNFRELSKKLDLNRNSLGMGNKLLRPSKMGLNKLNLDDFSKLDMEGIANLASSSSFGNMNMAGLPATPAGMPNLAVPGAANNLDLGALGKLDANVLKKLDINLSKLDVNSLGKLDVNEAGELGYKKYLEANEQPINELRSLSELNYKADLNTLRELHPMGELGGMNTMLPLNEVQFNEAQLGELRDKEPIPTQFMVPEHIPPFVQPSELGYDPKYPTTSEILGMAANQYAAGDLRMGGLKHRADHKRKKRGAKPKNELIARPIEPVLLNPVELPPLTVENWAQCENCKKWRRIPLSVDPEKLPETWVCSLNVWDPVYNSCSVPEEVYPEKVELKPLDTPANSASPDASFSNESELKYELPEPAPVENPKPKLPEPRLRGRHKSARDKEIYFDTRYRPSRRRQKYDARRGYGRGVYEEAYDSLRTPTNANRYYDEPRLSSKRRTHISPLISNMSSYDDDIEVVKFNISRNDQSAHPLKDRIALFSNNLTTLLATELPHSALFLDNLKKMNVMRDDPRNHAPGDTSRKAGRGKRAPPSSNKVAAPSGLDSLIDPLHRDLDLDAPLDKEAILMDVDSMLDRGVMLREANLGKDNPFLKEDGNINLAFARKTHWVHSHQKPPKPSLAAAGSRAVRNTRGVHLGASTRSSGDAANAGSGDKDVRFNKEDVFDNMIWFDELESSLKGGSRGDFGRFFKRLASQIPRLSEIKLSKPEHSNQHLQINEHGGSCSSAKPAGAEPSADSSALGAGSELLSTSCGLGEPDTALSDEAGSSSSFSAAHDYAATEYSHEPSFERDASSFENADSNYTTHRNVYDLGPMGAGGLMYPNGTCDSSIESTERPSSFGPDLNINEVIANLSSSYDSMINHSSSNESMVDLSASSNNAMVNLGASNNNNEPNLSASSNNNEPNSTDNQPEPPAFKTGTTLVNRQELMDVLYSFAKQYNSMTPESFQQAEQSGEDSPDSSAKRPRERYGRAYDKPILYCKRHQYFDDLMQTIVDYKEQVLDRPKEASAAQQAPLHEFEPAPRKRSKQSHALEEFKDDDKLEDDFQERDDASEKLDQELEIELKKELMQKRLESKLLKKDLLRADKSSHIDYPLPNIKQLSKRCRNLETKSLRRASHYDAGSKLMNSYSMLFQPIPDDIALGSSRDRMIQMLSVPIPYRQYRRESGRGAGSVAFSSGSSASVGSLTPYSNGVLAKSELLSRALAGPGSSSGGSSAPDSSGLLSSGQDFKFDNFDLLSLPIPDLSKTNTQCVI